jgi:hypothetical protein
MRAGPSVAKSSRKKAGTATWQGDNQSRSQVQNLINFGGHFEGGSTKEVIRAWKMDPEQLAVLRWGYCVPTMDAEPISTPGSFKLRTVLEILGCAVEDIWDKNLVTNQAAVKNLATSVGITASQYWKLQAFVQDLHARADIVKEEHAAAATYHYTLARPSWPSLLTMIRDASVFKVVPHRLPSNLELAVQRECCWLIDERAKSRVDDFGVICITDPAAAIFALRSSCTSLEKLALELVGQGIPILVPKPLDQIALAANAMGYHAQQSSIGQQRPFQYDFLVEDYLSYLRIFRTTVQEDARLSRLVLLSGGLAWRLALPFSDIEVILTGPSGYAVSSVGELSYRFDYEGRPLVEDRLLGSEIGMLIGRSNVPSHKRREGAPGSSAESQIAQPSFFPNLKAWSCSSLNHVGWTTMGERWLTSMDSRYRNANSSTQKMALQPVASNRWAKEVPRHFKGTRILANVRRDAVAFLTEYAQDLRGVEVPSSA